MNRTDELKNTVYGRKRLTVEEAVEYLLRKGFSNVLVDACGLWLRQNEQTKKRLGSKYTSCIDEKYDETIAYVEVENSRSSMFR